jgi:hypothetical protein
VAAGEIVGILGARGTGVMKTSYAATTSYNTTIFAQPVTLYRLVYQNNLYSVAAGPLSNELAGSFGRIELKYAP